MIKSKYRAFVGLAVERVLLTAPLARRSNRRCRRRLRPGEAMAYRKAALVARAFYPEDPLAYPKHALELFSAWRWGRRHVLRWRERWEGVSIAQRHRLARDVYGRSF